MGLFGRTNVSCEGEGSRPLLVGRHSWVQVVVRGGRAEARLHTTTHRLPRSLPITMAEASRLAAAGIPCTIEHVGDTDTEEVPCSSAAAGQ